MSITSHTKPKTKFEVFKDLVDKLEQAARAHEMRNSQRPEEWGLIDARLLATRSDLQAWYWRHFPK
jgi:hypothetical protein